jgi:hypothetical protein
MGSPTVDARTRDSALDMVEAEASANGGEVPRGAFKRASEAAGVHRTTVLRWYYGQDEEESAARSTHFARARERWRRSAVDAGERLLDHLMGKLDAGDKPLDDRAATNLLNVVQRIADNDKDAADLLQTINLRVNDGDRDVPDEAPPIPDLPDLDN